MPSVRPVLLAAMFLVALLFIPVGAGAEGQTPAQGKAIDRETFSLTLPSAWIEDTKDEDYDANALVTFERPQETCLVMVIIGKKSAGADARIFLEAEREVFEKQLTGVKTSPLTSWEGHAAKGYEMRGKSQGIMAARVRIVELDSEAHGGVLVEFAVLSDMAVCGPDFESLGKSFRLK
jgi:hypothetical protein